MSAKLIASSIAEHFSKGYDWTIGFVKASAMADLANEIEIAKAVQFLKAKETAKAIETLKAFEKKQDTKGIGAVATNLSFLYFLESDYSQAETYAESALTSDRYNARALTNLGNCLFIKGKTDKAKQTYQEAISMDATCVEAPYNLGLLYKRAKQYQEALACFAKLDTLLMDSPEVAFHIADIFHKLNDLKRAEPAYKRVISLAPTDPGVLYRYGLLQDQIHGQDRSESFQCMFEVNCLPDVIADLKVVPVFPRQHGCHQMAWKLLYRVRSVPKSASIL